MKYKPIKLLDEWCVGVHPALSVHLTEAQAEAACAILNKREPELTEDESVCSLIRRYWRFDDGQQPMSSWHEREDLIELLNKRGIK